jgi:hypothetical protein
LEVGRVFACRNLEAMWILKVNTVKKRSGLEKLIMESSKNRKGGQK